MRIASVACELPKTIFSNQDIVDIVEQASAPGFEGDLQKTLGFIKVLLRKSSMRERRMLTLDEKPFDYIHTAVHRALDEAQLHPEDVDMVIHASVDRRVAEPAMSFFLANALDMRNAQCFDVLEACASWMRAVDIAQGYLLGGLVKNVLIVTAEFGLHEGEWGRLPFQISKAEDLEFSYSGLTLGESTTATVLTMDDGPNWVFENATDSKFSELCILPIDITRPGTMQYGDVSLMGKGARRFSCDAVTMAQAGLPLAAKVFTERYKDIMDEIDIVIPHSHSYKIWLDQAASNNVEVPYYFTWQRTGNLGTGSIPAGLALAKEDGSLKRGDRVAAWMAAAGLSFTSVDFVF